MSLLSEWKQDYYDLWLNFKFELLKNYRQKRILLISVITIVIPALFYIIPVLTNNDLPDTADGFLSSIMGFVNLIVVLNAIFFGADALNSERYYKTALLIFPLPQRRTSIFFGKFIAQLLVSWIMIAFYYTTTATFVWIQYGLDGVPVVETTKSILFAYLYMTTLLSGAFFLSAVVNNPAASMTLTFFVVFLLVPIISLLLSLIDVNTSFIITNYSDFITRVYRFPDEGFTGPGGSSGSSDDITIERGIWLSLVYSIVLTFASWYINNEKEV